MVQTSHSDVVKTVVAYFSESKFADFFVDVEREIQMVFNGAQGGHCAP